MFLVSDTLEQTMNTFYEHHKSSINFAYRCFDRIFLNGLIQPFQQPERVIGFFNAYRNAERVTRNCLRDIAQQFQNWLKNRCEKWGVAVLDAPEGRRDDFVDPYFKQAKTDQVVVILKAREPDRIMIAIGSEDRWHLQFAQRWITQYNFGHSATLGFKTFLLVGCASQHFRSFWGAWRTIAGYEAIHMIRKSQACGSVGLLHHFILGLFAATN
jgi:hypothetical protein